MRNHIAANKSNMLIEAGWVPANLTLSGGADRYYDTDIVVMPSCTLTVQNVTLHMAKGRKIILEPGARLVTHNATFTNWPAGGCAAQSGPLWTGIVLQTNSNSAIPATASLAAGTIEHADAALFFDMTGGENTAPQPVVVATGVMFKNNVSAVSFHNETAYVAPFNTNKQNRFPAQ